MMSDRLRTASTLLVACATLTLLDCRTATLPPAQPYRVVAYVRGRAEIHRISAEKLTHINYAFATVSADGQVVFEQPDAPSHLAQLQALKAKNPDLKVIVSVGGWGADNFSDAALTDGSRARFAVSAIELMKQYALDGIDLDWEYPGQPGPGIKFRPEDKENFTLMLKTLRGCLDELSDERHKRPRDRYSLTIASAGEEYFDHTEMETLHVYLDWINIMTYDFFTEGSTTTGHHSALHSVEKDNRRLPSTESFVRQHLEAGIPRSKLVIGVPFYGRAWTGVTADNNGLHQPFAGYSASYSYATLRRDYVGRQGFRREWDEKAKVPFLWNPTSGTLISYEDPDSLKEKALFIKRERLGGVMYWEHSHDPEEILLDALVQNLK